MGNCLITKLKGVVNDDNLDYFNKLKIVYEAQSVGTKVFTEFYINEGDTVTFTILSGNAKFIPDGSSEELDTITLTGLNLPHLPQYKDMAYCEIKHLDGNEVTILAENLNTGNLKGVEHFSAIDLDKVFLYSPNCYYFRISQVQGVGVEGKAKLSKLSNIPTGMKVLIINKGTVGILKEGTLSDIARLTDLERIEITDNRFINGYISALGPCIKLTFANFYGQHVSGTIESFAAAQVAAGRTSGTVELNLQYNDNVTYMKDGVATPVPWSIYVKYSPSYENGYLVSETA